MPPLPPQPPTNSSDWLILSDDIFPTVSFELTGSSNGTFEENNAMCDDLVAESVWVTLDASDYDTIQVRAHVKKLGFSFSQI